MRGSARSLAVLGAAMACSGCISLFPKGPAPAALYNLEPVAADLPQAEGAHAATAIVAVDAPSGLPTFLGDDLAWQEDSSVSFISGASWTGQARVLLQRLLVEYLDATGDVRAAAPTGDGARPTHLLRWDVSEFQIYNGDGVSEARFSATATLVYARNRELIGVYRMREREPLRSRSSKAAAMALREVARRGSQSIGRWAGQQAEAHPVSPSASVQPPAGS